MVLKDHKDHKWAQEVQTGCNKAQQVHKVVFATGPQGTSRDNREKTGATGRATEQKQVNQGDFLLRGTSRTTREEQGVNRTNRSSRSTRTSRCKQGTTRGAKVQHGPQRFPGGPAGCHKGESKVLKEHKDQ